MAYASTVPAALAGLVSAFKAEPALEGVDVYGGPAVSESKALAAIMVGFAGETMARTGAYPVAEQPQVELTASLDGLSVTPSRESYTIQSLLAVLNGAKNVTAARTRAYQLLGGIGAAITADRKLGGAVALARLGGHSLKQEQTAKGALISVVFEVSCEAWTRR